MDKTTIKTKLIELGQKYKSSNTHCDAHVLSLISYISMNSNVSYAIHGLVVYPKTPTEIQTFLSQFILNDLKLIFFMFLRKHHVFHEFMENYKQFNWKKFSEWGFGATVNGLDYFQSIDPRTWLSKAFPWDKCSGTNTSSREFKKWAELNAYWHCRVEQILYEFLNKTIK